MPGEERKSTIMKGVNLKPFIESSTLCKIKMLILVMSTLVI